MRKLQSGFTLIEVMIVLVIVAILAAIAIPSYQDQVNRARRTDATEALLSIAGLQERYFLQHNGYAEISDNVFSSHTEEDYYEISMADSLPCVAAGSPVPDRLSCYIVEAVPGANSPQQQDVDCAKFTIDNAGRRLAYDNSNALNDECW